jgi:hypothetical protein
LWSHESDAPRSNVWVFLLSWKLHKQFSPILIRTVLILRELQRLSRLVLALICHLLLSLELVQHSQLSWKLWDIEEEAI